MWIGLEAKNFLKPWRVVTEGGEGLLIATSRPARQAVACLFQLVVPLPASGLIGCFRPKGDR